MRNSLIMRCLKTNYKQQSFSNMPENQSNSNYISPANLLQAII